MRKYSNQSIPEISLDILKVSIKVFDAITSEEIQVKEHLEYMVSVIESNKSEEIVKCNIDTVAKYPQILDIASSYGLAPMQECKLRHQTLEYQIKSLHRITHLLYNKLAQRIFQKVVNAVIEVTAEKGIVYGIKNMSESE